METILSKKVFTVDFLDERLIFWVTKKPITRTGFQKLFSV